MSDGPIMSIVGGQSIQFWPAVYVYALLLSQPKRAG